MESYNFADTVIGSLSNIVVVYENILSDDDCEPTLPNTLTHRKIEYRAS